MVRISWSVRYVNYCNAHGILNDQSSAMIDLARARLERFSHRMSYVIGDATAVNVMRQTAEADTVLTSRMTHMLGAASLLDFYTNLSINLPKLQSVCNIDHVGGPPKWFNAMFKARFELLERDKPSSSCWHNQHLPSEADHQESLRQAQFFDVTPIWKAYYTMAFVAMR